MRKRGGKADTQTGHRAATASWIPGISTACELFREEVFGIKGIAAARRGQFHTLPREENAAKETAV